MAPRKPWILVLCAGHVYRYTCNCIACARTSSHACHLPLKSYVVERKALLSAVVREEQSRRPVLTLVGGEADHHLSDSLLDKELAPQRYR